MESKVMYYEKDRPEQRKWGGKKETKHEKRKNVTKKERKGKNINRKLGQCANVVVEKRINRGETYCTGEKKIGLHNQQ